MLLSTDEASIKNCPLTMGNDMRASHCLGEKCMAWQWEELGYGGGVAALGFCGFIIHKGHRKEQACHAF